jgi:tyrosyl-tRNA synthetase
MIGDPSGRSTERNLLDRDELEANVASIRAQLERFLDFSGASGAMLVNNLDWLDSIGLIEFLRDIGKHFTVPYMLAKDSVQVRLDRGLSFTEFSYMLLQAADFEHLHRTMGVELQMGGADQWGNITAGLELIRRRAGLDEGAATDPAHGLAYPLLLSASGAKFGKTEGGESIWLDPALTSPYAFYQHWLNTDDRDVGVYLRWFTLLSADAVATLEAELAARPEARGAQRALAFDATARTHGEDAARQAETRSRAVFEQGLVGLGLDDFLVVSRDLPTRFVPADAASTAAGIAVASGAVSSNGEARRLVAQGGLYINDIRVLDPNASSPEPLHERFWVVRTGKKTIRIAERGG